MKIKTQFLVSIIFVIVLSISSAAYVTVNDMRRVLKQEIDLRIRFLMDSVKGVAGDSLGKNDLLTLNYYIKEASAGGGLAYIIVTDRYDNIVASSNQSDKGSEITNLYPAITKGGDVGEIKVNGTYKDVISYVSPVYLKSKDKNFEVGKVYAGFDKKAIDSTLDFIYIKSAAIALVIIFISIFLTLFITGRIIIPLNRLLEGTEKIAAGDLKFKIKVNVRNEFQALANSFNQMTNKLNDYYEGILNAFMIAMDTKNKYSPSHSMRVARTAVKIGKAMNLSATQIENLRIASILMDIGNIGVQDGILDKKELLTAEDFIQIQKHPEISAKILKNIPDLKEVVPIIMEHHERYDGMGYPAGLKGEAIMTESRVLAIADAYDAMITEHGHKKPVSAEEAIYELRSNKGKQFDPDITEIFVGLLNKEGGV